jgi:hypothetical protein
MRGVGSPVVRILQSTERSSMTMGNDMNDDNRNQGGQAGAAWQRLARCLAPAFAAAVLLVAAAAHAAETVQWEDLAPPEPKENAISSLTSEQKTNLYRLFVGPKFAGEAKTRNAEEQKAYDELKASGADPDALLATVIQIRKDQQERDNTLLYNLDRKAIRLAGYALPLDFKGTQVKSFLLVPYVGACIHTPPPPPNQIIYVQADEPFVTEELFAPVWVTGEIRVGKGQQALSLVDGVSDIDFGYSLKATRIEPYEEK